MSYYEKISPLNCPLDRETYDFIENSVFHGIGICDYRKTRTNTGISRVVDNRVGVIKDLSSEDEHWMRLALENARRAEQAGEVPVGAVLVRDNQLIAEGFNQPITSHDSSAHAEITTLRAAGLVEKNYRLPDSTLYVTLEPCPMCAGALIHARVARLVFAATDPKTGAAGSVFDLINDSRHNHQVNVQGGLLADESSELLKTFFQARR